MTAHFAPILIKQYAKLLAAIRKKVDRQVGYLGQTVLHSGMNARKMSGYADIWEARIDEHYRLTFKLEEDVITLRKVGTHEIYRKP